MRHWLDGLGRSAPPPTVGLLTGNIRLGAEIKLRHYGLWEYFRMGAFGDDEADRNRLAAVARQRGEGLLGRGLRREEVLVVGDTPWDIACAKHVGARVLAVATGPYPVPALQAHQPDWAVPDLTHLSVGEVLGEAG